MKEKTQISFSCCSRPWGSQVHFAPFPPPLKLEECPALPVMLQNGLFLPNSEQPGTMVVTILNLQLLLGLAP